MSMIRLSPSILSADFARLGAECQEVLKAGADMIHFDVMDGHFVHNISFGLPVLESIRKALPNAPQMEESVQVLGGHNPRFVFRQYG